MTRRSHLVAAAVASMLLASCGEQVGTGQNEDQTPTFPRPPEQLPDDVEQPDVVIPVPPAAEAVDFVPLSLDDPRLATEFPVTLVARPDGAPYVGEFEGRARVERGSRAILLETEEVAIALQLPRSMELPEVPDEVDLAVSYFDDPSETGGANHSVEITDDGRLVAATTWSTSPDPIEVKLADLTVSQSEVEPDPRSEYTPVPALINGEVDLVLFEPQRFDDKIVVANQSERFVAADDADTYGETYILRLWVISERG